MYIVRECANCSRSMIDNIKTHHGKIWLLYFSGNKIQDRSANHIAAILKVSNRKQDLIPLPSKTLAVRKEGNIIFNDAHNTVYLQLYASGTW